MPLSIGQIKDIIVSIFSETGYKIKNFTLKFANPLDVNIDNSDNSVVIMTFGKNLPKVSWKRLITFSASVQKITLGPSGGSLKLKYFPDIKFPYSENNKEEWHSTIKPLDMLDVQLAIDEEYSDEEQKKIASSCLQYAHEWATIAHSSGESFSDTSSRNKKKLKNDCKNFIIENFKQDTELNYGSTLALFLFFYVVLPVILKFVLEKFFNQLFNT